MSLVFLFHTDLISKTFLHGYEKIKLCRECLCRNPTLDVKYTKNIINIKTKNISIKEGVNFFVSLKLEVPFSWN
jgi:hypothetical protein